MSPNGFVDGGWSDASISLDSLPSRVRDSLVKLAEGRAEPIGSTIREICAWLESSGFEGTVADAVTFYVSNYGYV